MHGSPVLAAAPSEPSSVCTEGSTNALSEIGCELGRQVKLQQPTLVVSGPVVADGAILDTARLAGRIASVVAGGLGEFAHAHPVEAKLGAAQLAAAKQGALLFVEPRVSGGHLEVVANLYPIARSFWDRVRKPHPSPTLHAFAKRALDPELRSFFAPIPLVAKQTIQAAPPELGPVALACGDADADGSDEIAFIGRRRVALGRIRRGSFAPLVAKDWPQLSPVAAAPLTEPIAGVSFRKGQGIDIGSSDRALFLRLTPELELVSNQHRRIPIEGACLALHGTGLALNPILCLPGDSPPPQPSFTGVADVAVGSSMLNQSGVLTHYLASYVARDNSLTLQAAGRTLATLEGAGAQLALGDLNGDGAPELLTSVATRNPKQDALRVYSLSQEGMLLEKLRLPVPDGITALGVCKPDTTRMGTILIGTHSRLWVVQ